MARNRNITSQSEKDFKIEITHANGTVIGWVNLSDSFTKKTSGIPAKDLQFNDLDADKVASIISNCDIKVSQLVEATANGYDDFE